MILIYFAVGSTSSGSAFVIVPNLGAKTIFESISPWRRLLPLYFLIQFPDRISHTFVLFKDVTLTWINYLETWLRSDNTSWYCTVYDQSYLVSYVNDKERERKKKRFVTSTPGQVSDVRHRGTPYRGMLHCWRTVAAEEGARSLYSGLAPALLRQVIQLSVYVSLVQNTRIWYHCFLNKKNNYWHLTLIDGAMTISKRTKSLTRRSKMTLIWMRLSVRTHNLHSA